MTTVAGDRRVGATVLEVGGVGYAVTGRVVRSLPAARPLPASVPHGGRAFPVIDLPGLFGASAGDRTGELIVLVEREELCRALVVEGVSGRTAIDPDAVQPVPAVYPEAERGRWDGLVVREGACPLVLLRLEGFPTSDGRFGSEG